MGEIRARVRLENRDDQVLFEAGHIRQEGLRACEIEAVADTGAVMTLLPQDVVESLGLKVISEREVILANDQQIRLPVAAGLRLIVLGRDMETDCLVGPPGCEALIGQIVMERLDLIADPGRRALLPRLPDGPIIKMKVATAA